MAKNSYRPLDRTIGYSVLEIATSRNELYSWTDDPDQQQLVLQQAKDADITHLPVKQGDQITGLVRRNGLKVSEPIPLTADWLIAADTPILHLIELFAAKMDRVFLVLQSSEVVGLVAPADLNKVPARASIYLLTAQFEAELINLVRTQLGEDEEELEKLLTNDRVKKLREDHDKAEKGDVNLSLFYHLYLSDLFTIVSKHGRLRTLLGFTSRSQVDKCLNFTDLRDRVSHLTGMLLTSRDELENINTACDTMIELSHKIGNLNGQ